jgi:flagellar biogenesis protein FliO
VPPPPANPNPSPPSPTVAAPVPAPPGLREVDDAADLGWVALKMLAVLAAVAVIGGLLARTGAAPAWLRRVVGGRAGAETGLIRVHESRPLEPGKTLHLVEVAGRFVLVGSSPEGLTALTAATLADADIRARLAADQSSAPAASDGTAPPAPGGAAATANGSSAAPSTNSPAKCEP